MNCCLIHHLISVLLLVIIQLYFSCVVETLFPYITYIIDYNGNQVSKWF